MIYRKCPRCGKRIAVGSTCECQQKFDRERHRDYSARRSDAAEQKFYRSTTWQKARQSALSRDRGLCRLCFEEKRITPAALVHHIVPIKEGGPKTDLDNLLSVCASCHQKIHDSDNFSEREKQKRLSRIPPAF